MLFLFKFFCLFLSLDLLFVSYHFQFLLFSDSLTMHCLVLILFLNFCFFPFTRVAGQNLWNCWTDKDLVINQLTHLSLSLPLPLHFSSYLGYSSSFPHPRCRKHSRGICIFFVPKNAVHRRNRLSEGNGLWRLPQNPPTVPTCSCMPIQFRALPDGVRAGGSGSCPIEVSFPVNSNLLGSWIVVARQT